MVPIVCVVRKRYSCPKGYVHTLWYYLKPSMSSGGRGKLRTMDELGHPFCPPLLWYDALVCHTIGAVHVPIIVSVLNPVLCIMHPSARMCDVCHFHPLSIMMASSLFGVKYWSGCPAKGIHLVHSS